MIYTNAIVLSTKPYKEHDIMASLYMKDFGKRTVLVRGAREPLSKLSPFLHVPGIVRCGFVEGKGLPVLTDLDIVFSPLSGRIYTSSARMVYAFLELCDSIFYEEQKDTNLWNLLVDVLNERDSEHWSERLRQETYVI